jgi:translocation and assembly module TamB
MTEPAHPPLTPQTTEDTPAPRKKSFILRFFGAAALLFVICIALLAWWMSSAQFAEMIRRHLESAIADATGARVEIGTFHWSLRHLEADAGDILLHGNEPASEAPLTHIDHLHAGVSILGFLSPRILLRELIVQRPRIHIIVYPDQTTNLPQPHKPPNANRSGLDTFFDLQAGHIAVEQGMIHFDARAEAFDFKSRYQPLDFQANDFSIILQYAPATLTAPESYHIDTGVADLNFARGPQRTPAQVQGLMQASIDLTRTAAYLRSAHITARARGQQDRTLQITGELDNFTHPRWQANLNGEFDLHLLDPTLGYADAPEGIAHLNLDASGTGGRFRIDGPLRIEQASYIGSGINARNINLTTRVHADNSVLHIAQIVVHPRQGGEIGGDVNLQHWLPVPTASLAPYPPEHPSHDILVKAPILQIPVDGRVTASFRNVALDTILDFVSPPAFRRLGIGAFLNGPAEATWSRGDVNTLSVHAAVNASAPNLTPPGEAPATGAIDATYTQRNGGVEVRTLNLTFPATQIEAHGHIGAFPLTSPTSLNVDGHSHNLAEFDSVLRDLGLGHEGKAGTAALPVALHGAAEFQVLWEGSLVSPRLSGNVKATQIGIEIPPPAGNESAQPHWVSWDSIEAEGSYDAERIAIAHGHLRRGTSEIVLDGTITAAANQQAEEPQPGRRPRGQNGVNEQPEFNSASLLHAHIHATKVSVADLLPIVGLDLPITGILDAQFEAQGPLSSPGGSGSVQLTDAVIYGEPISHVRSQGSLEDHVLHLNSLTVQSPAGTVTASGTYDLRARHFNAQAHGSNLDLAQVKYLHSRSENVLGRLTFTATASGTPDDPHIDGHAELANIAVEGKALGAAQLTAHTVNRALAYEITSHTETADLHLSAQTELHGDFVTQAQVQLSRFNIGAALKLARVDGVSVESEVSGIATASGPLKYPERIRGDLRLDQAAATIDGVPLRSAGPIHASLADSRIHLDSIHILGEQTDLHTQGTLDLRGDRMLDVAGSGSVNLKLAETLDKDLTASGVTNFQVQARGPLANPQLHGSIEIEDGALSLGDLPNGLSHIKGRLEFNQNRLEVRSLTAMSGGGQLTLGGYLAYQRGIYADLTVSGRNIRVRYPAGVSSIADASLRLQGTQNNFALTGNVFVTRFTVSPDLDIATLVAQSSAPATLVPPDSPANHIRLDVHIQSSPQLNFQNAFARLAGEVDLRLRGTLASPSLLGRISITEGSATIAGTRYTLQRGEITFSNPVRIQPSLDLNATARVEDFDITLSLHGTPDRLSINYRSDPPLPQSDVVALLAIGRTQTEQGLYTQQQQQAVNTTDVLLGGALNATMSSRVQRLFGAGSVKVDPSFLGALGNSTTRITVEEQLGRFVTLTYATNVDTSAQQLIQAEIAVNRHVSILVQRDESGVFSMVLKNTRRYR